MEFSVDGRKVYAATGGRPFDPALPAVVLLHGAAMDHTAWALQSRYFAHHGRAVLALDLPGCGRSEGPMPETIEDFAAWTLRLLDAAGLAKARLVGHSMGALIALATAAAAPERVERLALLGAATPMAVNDDFLEAARRNDHLAIELMNDWAHGRAAHLGGSKMPGLWMVGNDIRLIERAADGVLYHCLKICSDYQGGLAAAAQVTCPTIMVVGERDLMTPLRAARQLAEKLPDVEVKLLDDCGHIMMVERPDELLAALKQAV